MRVDVEYQTRMRFAEVSTIDSGTYIAVEPKSCLNDSDPRSRLDQFLKIYESVSLASSSETLYQAIVDELAAVFECDFINLYLISVGTDSVAEQAFHGNRTGRTVKKGEHLSFATGRFRRLIENHEPIITDFQEPHPEDVMPAQSAKRGRKKAISIPLLAHNEVVGVVNMSYNSIDTWEKLDIEYLSKIGRMLGVILQQNQSLKKYTELQALVERRRLGAEIHDNLSQLVSLLGVSVDNALAFSDEGNDEAVRRVLERIRATSQQALAVMREEILYLRMPVHMNLINAIEECLGLFSSQWDIYVECETDKIRKPLIVSAQTELQVTRILHEALSNTLRHADASKVFVELEERRRWITLRIRDDGCGFKPESVPKERLGLRIMKERSESFGGRFTVKSKINQGTTVIVDIPKQSVGKAYHEW